MKLSSNIIAPPASRVALIAVFLAAFAASTLALNTRAVYEPLATSRFDNVEIAGTTDATGTITARGGLRLMAPTTGPIFLSGIGSPDGVIVATTGSIYLDTGTAAIWQNDDGNTAWNQIQYATVFTDVAPGIVPASGGGTSNFLRADGTWAAPSGGGGSTPTISAIAFSTPAANVNLSTLGDLDWYRMDYAMGAATELASVRASAQTGTRFKLLGGVAGQSLMYSLRGVRGATLPSFNSNTIAGTTFTTTAADDSTGSAGSSTAYAVFFTSANVNPVDFGWEFAVPAQTNVAQKVIRIYYSASGSANITVDVTGSLSGVTATNTNAASVGQSVYLATFTITGGLVSEVFRVRIRATSNPTGSISVCLAAITIGTA